MHQLLSDIRLAARHLRRNSAFTLVAVITLTIGIAANTVVFSYVYGALLRPPPFREPDRLVVLYRTFSESGRAPYQMRWSFQRSKLLREWTSTVRGISAFGRSDWNLTGDGMDPERVPAEGVTHTYFETLGVKAALGRTFAPEEGATPGTHPVTVISHGLWVRRFGADSAALGRVITVNGRALTVIGVMPRGFTGLTGRADLWVPEMMVPWVGYDGYLTSDQNFISLVARLAPNATMAAVNAELAAVGAKVAAAAPDEVDVPTTFSARAVPLGDARIDRSNRRWMLLLFAAVGFLMLLACANLAGLGLARAISRRSELTVRLALGAGRGRLLRQLLTESALLGALGGVVGVVATLWILRVVAPPSTGPTGANMWGAVGSFAAARVDLVVLAFSALSSLVAVLLSGLVPAWHAGRTDLASELKGRASAAAGGRRALSCLVTIEVGLATVLSFGAALLLSSLDRLQSYPLGFDPKGVLTFRVQPPSGYDGPGQAVAFWDDVLARIAAVPGVRSASVDACTPLAAGCASSQLFIVGRPEPRPGQATPISRHYVGPAHFETLGIRVMRGRAFTPEDRAGRPKVTVINETAARRFWPDQDPLGQRVWFTGSPAYAVADSSAEIVGVVSDVPYGAVDPAPYPSFYTPYRQFTYAGRVALVRADGDPARLLPAMRAVLRDAANLPLFEAATLEEKVGEAWARPRFNAAFLATFAGLALLVAASGVYGVVSHTVSQRIRELGIRAALGATEGRLVRMVMAQGVRLTAIGVIAGIAVALPLARLMRALLFEVSPTDSRLIAAQAVVLLAATAVASWLPARHAAKADPSISLRAE